MTVDTTKLEKLMQIIKNNYEKLVEIKNEGKKEFVDNYKNYNTALRLLQISIEAMMNIGSHIIARKSLGNPEDYVSIFRILKEKKIINDDDFSKFSKMVKFRNRIVHIYWDVDVTDVYNILESNLDDFLIFINKMKGVGHP